MVSACEPWLLLTLPPNSPDTEPAVMKPAALMGRLANGAERDAGTLVHLVPDETIHYGHTARALCGAKPGRRSGGWDTDHYAGGSPTCIRCVSKEQRRAERSTS